MLHWIFLIFLVCTAAQNGNHICDAEFDSLGKDNMLAWRRCMDRVARTTVDKYLRPLTLNVVTAESLTGGMISSTLVDLSPGYGSYVYGGFTVYDSDAKRMFIDVTYGDVYTEITARQMAAGSLRASRAMIALAVTGYSAPAPAPGSIGQVDIAASLRTRTPGNNGTDPNQKYSGNFTTAVRRVQLCTDVDGAAVTVQACDQYKTEVAAKGTASAETIMVARNMVRMETVVAALTLLNDLLAAECGPDSSGGGCDRLAYLPSEAYDGQYTQYGEPSVVIQDHLKPQW